MRAVLLCALALSSLPAWADERFALVIGANVGWANDRPLRHAEADAERMAAVLTELGDFAPSRVEYLRDPDTATVRARLRRLSDTVRSRTGPTLVFVYYSGHADERFLHLRGAPLSHDELYGALRDLPATVRLGVIDACRSGSILGTKGGRPTTLFSVRLDEPVSGLAILTSSGADELSQETRALAGSVFTHHLVSALRGAADDDADGQVTLAEAYRHAHQRTEVDTLASAVPQRPAFRFELKGQGEIVLTRLVAASARLVLPRGQTERYVVVDQREWRLLAEGVPASDKDTALGLLPGDYRVKRLFPDHLLVASLALAPGATKSAAELEYARVPLSSGVLKGQPDAQDPYEVREFRRGEALRLLAQGEAGTALNLFETLLKEDPADLPSHRGRARALVRLAEAYDKVGDHERERNALRSALRADPSLAEDPDFESWYRRLSELEAQQRRDVELRTQVEAELRDNPRLTRRFGLNFELISTRGLAVLGAAYMPRHYLFLDGAVDLAGPGIDLGVRWVPFGWLISPYAGGGLHFALSNLGLTPWGQGSMGEVTYDELFRRAARLEAGIQYFGSLGFSAQLGLGVVFFVHPRTHAVSPIVLPAILHVGWYF